MDVDPLLYSCYWPRMYRHVVQINGNPQKMPKPNGVWSNGPPLTCVDQTMCTGYCHAYFCFLTSSHSPLRWMKGCIVIDIHLHTVTLCVWFRPICSLKWPHKKGIYTSIWNVLSEKLQQEKSGLAISISILWRWTGYAPKETWAKWNLVKNEFIMFGNL